MSQGKDKERRTPELDLDKRAVTDLTPKAEPVVHDPIDPAPAEAVAANTPPPPPPRLQTEKPSGALPVGAGAVAGALFGLLGAIVYQNIQKPPVTVADPRVSQVEAAIAAVERKTVEAGQIEQRLLAQVKAVEGKMAALDERAMALAAQAAALDKRSSALDQKAVSAEQKAVAADQRAAAAESRAATLIVPVDDRLKAAEARLADAQDRAAALGKRIDLLAQLEPPKVDLKPIVNKVEELERSLVSNIARVTLSGETTLALDGRVKTVEQSIRGVEAVTKSADTSIKGLETSVAELKSRTPAESAGAVMAVAGLARRSLDQGEPLGPLTMALGALGVPQASLSPFSPYAQVPAPNAAALATLFDDLAKKAKPSAPAAAPTGDSLVDRVTSGLWSQVDVRPVGKTAANDATGIAVQVRQRLTAGDYAGANALVGALSAEQQVALKPFSDAVAARVGALNALRAIEKDALATAARKG